MMDPEWLVAYGTISLAVATVGLAAVSVFQDQIRGWLTRPKLTVSVALSPPDCHQIPYTYETASLASNRAQADSYYFRLKISNKGKTAARMAEVFVESLKLRRQDGTLTIVDWFLPMNLL